MVEKEILGMICYDREKAAEAINKSVSTIDKMVAASRRKGKHKKLRFLQEGKGCSIWFPRDWLLEYLTTQIT